MPESPGSRSPSFLSPEKPKIKRKKLVKWRTPALASSKKLKITKPVPFFDMDAGASAVPDINQLPFVTIGSPASMQTVMEYKYSIYKKVMSCLTLCENHLEHCKKISKSVNSAICQEPRSLEFQCLKKIMDLK